MTADEWGASDDPDAMSRLLRDRLSDRKWRLFNCACVRRIWHLLADERLRAAVAMAERHADGRVDARTYGAAVTDANRARSRRRADWAAYNAARYVPGEASLDTPSILSDCRSAMARVAVWEQDWVQPPQRVVVAFTRTEGGEYQPAEPSPEFLASLGPLPPPRPYTHFAGGYTADPIIIAAETRAQAALLRDIAGDPFGPPSTEAAWLTADVIAAARRVYEAAEFHRVRDVGAALVAANCDDAALLAHCFAPTEHARGCWAVDRLLGLT